MVPIWVIFIQRNTRLYSGITSKILLVLMAAHPWSVLLLVFWIYSRLGIDNCLFSTCVSFLVSKISLLEMLLAILAQHDEVLCALMRKPIVCNDDLKLKSSDAVCDKEAWIAVILLPLWKDLPYRWRDIVFWETWWLQPLVVPLNSLLLVHKNLLHYLHTAS